MSANPYPYDYIAVGPHGVYAICSDIPGDPDVRAFITRTLYRGHHVEHVPVAVAVERHRAFLAKAPSPTDRMPAPAAGAGHG